MCSIFAFPIAGILAEAVEAQLRMIEENIRLDSPQAVMERHLVLSG